MPVRMSVEQVSGSAWAECPNGVESARRRGLGIASILCVMAAFTALAQAVKDIELSLAYAIWGGFGILATVAMGWALFGQRLAWRGWLGLLLLLAGMSLLKLA
ncbi:multidrug/spermidine efflux SMR transporter subunit MdtI [Pseudomonas aeruginosa]|uniref:multidrug/spermidine efflux SMR transporter subunit MdtI n=1 Tax=Pseudomonas aeruginosa TaxID=287 RepID=UPI00402B8381